MSLRAPLLKVTATMINQTEAIHKHLGVRIDADEIDHYTLLGLEPNANPEQIKQALRMAVNAWNHSDTKSDPESAQWVAKRLKQAQSVLLDTQKKNAYDASLREKASHAENSFFPDADPYAPFDPAECLVASGPMRSFVDFGNADDRWSELGRRIPRLLQTSSQDAVAFEAPAIAIADPPTINKTPLSGATAFKIEQLRRKRMLSQRIYLAGFLTLAAAFLAYAGIQFAMNRYQVAQRSENDAKESAVKSDLPKLPENGPKSIGGHLAPKGTGNSSGMVLPTLSREELPEGSPREFTENNPFGMTPKAAWVAAMKSAREAIDNADFERFHNQMEIALPLSSSVEMTAKQARLDQLGQLYEIFIKAVREAKTKMRGTESLSVGKSIVSIVEIKEDELIVRLQGQNERYSWDRLPPGIANAMADFTLSEREPTDLAARAVYFSLSPARNDLFAKKVKDWFEKSVGKGSVRKDLVQALTDTYE